ncbi:hypothetical protein [Luteolibacter sp. Populi]|uniref:hypothetical protein n=1 Tax=Luteolibacter sp. Populi TaxID=3230487 RepID=UPI003467200C
MDSNSSLPSDSRRDFVKKSLAASIIAAQPTILAGLIRAQGGGGGGNNSWDTTSWDTTGGETGGWDTTVETTEVDTTLREKYVIVGAPAADTAFLDGYSKLDFPVVVGAGVPAVTLRLAAWIEPIAGSSYTKVKVRCKAQGFGGGQNISTGEVYLEGEKADEYAEDFSAVNDDTSPAPAVGSATWSIPDGTIAYHMDVSLIALRDDPTAPPETWFKTKILRCTGKLEIEKFIHNPLPTSAGKWNIEEELELVLQIMPETV